MRNYLPVAIAIAFVAATALWAWPHTHDWYRAHQRLQLALQFTDDPATAQRLADAAAQTELSGGHDEADERTTPLPNRPCTLRGRSGLAELLRYPNPYVRVLVAECIAGDDALDVALISGVRHDSEPVRVMDWHDYGAPTYRQGTVSDYVSAALVERDWRHRERSHRPPPERANAEAAQVVPDALSHDCANDADCGVRIGCCGCPEVVPLAQAATALDCSAADCPTAPAKECPDGVPRCAFGRCSAEQAKTLEDPSLCTKNEDCRLVASGCCGCPDVAVSEVRQQWSVWQQSRVICTVKQCTVLGALGCGKRAVCRQGLCAVEGTDKPVLGSKSKVFDRF